jgi:hypothetical protein
MSRPKQDEPNIGSLSVSTGKGSYQWRRVEFTFSSEDKAFYLKDTIARKKFGPYLNTKEVKAEGKEFWLDNGNRAAGIKTKRVFKAKTESPTFERAGSLAQDEQKQTSELPQAAEVA